MPGGMKLSNWYWRAIRAAMKRLTPTSAPPAADRTSRRSAFADTRSCSRKRQRKWRTRRRSRMFDDHVGDVRGRSFRIRAQHELRKYFLQGPAAHQTLQGL